MLINIGVRSLMLIYSLVHTQIILSNADLYKLPTFNMIYYKGNVIFANSIAYIYINCLILVIINIIINLHNIPALTFERIFAIIFGEIHVQH